MKQSIRLRSSTNGFSPVMVIVVIAVIALLGGGGWYVWQRNQKDNTAAKDTASQQADGQKKEEADNSKEELAKDPASEWTLGISQAGRLSMRIPDGWSITSYPGNYFGSTHVTYKAGQAAQIETTNTDYTGHTLRFRASIAELDDAGLGPQWESPQEGVDESTESFTVDGFVGKRYKAVFSEMGQTLYEYVFSVGSSQKLDIVYTVNHKTNDSDDVAIVEQAIKTISIK